MCLFLCLKDVRGQVLCCLHKEAGCRTAPGTSAWGFGNAWVTKRGVAVQVGPHPRMQARVRLGREAATRQGGAQVLAAGRAFSACVRATRDAYGCSV